MRRPKRRAASLLLALASTWACATPVLRRDWSQYQGPGAAAFHQPELPPPEFPDPLEPLNRGVSVLNHGLIVGVVDPVGRVYRLVIPRVVRDHVRTFAANLIYPRNLVANLLQGHFAGARDETLRFLVNTTVGGLGFFDPAAGWGIEPAEEDLGQTLAVWGWQPSTYLVLPLFGPSTLRDAVGLVPDSFLDPATYFFPAGPVLNFNQLVDSVDDYERFVASSFDPYDDARIVWTLNRDESIFDYRFRARHDETAPVQTLQAAFLSPRSPDFAKRLCSGQAIVSSTGRALPFSYRMQPAPAPLLFLLPGLGSHRLAGSSLALAEMAWDRGFSVAILSSALNWEFMQRAAGVAVPGNAPVDAHDVHRALDAVSRELTARYGDRITRRVLMGYSLGAFHALYIAAEEGSSDEPLVQFDRIVALDPPVRLLYGLRRLDAFYDAPLAFPVGERKERTLEILRKALYYGKEALRRREGGVYSRIESAEHGGGTLEPGVELPFSNLEAEYLIGLAFRRTLQEIIYASQERQDLGVLRTPRSPLRRLPAYQEIGDYGYSRYLYAFVLPYYRDVLHEIGSAEELATRNDLHSIADRLRGNPKIEVFANRNDFLTSRDDVAWLSGLLGPDHVRFFPSGGHLGNLYRPDVQREIMDSLADLKGAAPP